MTRAFRPDVYSSGGASCLGGPTLPSLVSPRASRSSCSACFTILPVRAPPHVPSFTCSRSFLYVLFFFTDSQVFRGGVSTAPASLIYLPQREKRRRHALRPLLIWIYDHSVVFLPPLTAATVCARLPGLYRIYPSFGIPPPRQLAPPEVTASPLDWKSWCGSLSTCGRHVLWRDYLRSSIARRYY